MRKAKMLMLAVLTVGLLTGCSKFSPDETAVSIGKDGEVTAAVLDKLDQNYYNADELKTNVETAVAEYAGSAGEDSVKIDKFEIEEDGSVKLFMKYAGYKDYAEFNNVDFYVGDITDGYNNGGYRFETTFHQIENGEVTNDKVDRKEIFAGSNHPMIVFQEDMAVEVPGKILYVSSNVEVTGKKSARMAGAGATAESESETEAERKETTGTEVPEIAPAEVVVSGGEEDTDSTLAYIIYE